MRPTELQFRDPRELTPDFYNIQVLFPREGLSHLPLRLFRNQAKDLQWSSKKSRALHLLSPKLNVSELRRFVLLTSFVPE